MITATLIDNVWATKKSDLLSGYKLMLAEVFGGKEAGKRLVVIDVISAGIGDRVIVSSGAKVLGPFHVGNDVKIGSGSVVLKEIPDGCTVVGVPGRVVRRFGESTSDINQINLPDPVTTEMEVLRRRLELMEEKVEKLTKELNEREEEKE